MFLCRATTSQKFICAGQEATLDERLAAAGGVPDSLVKAVGAVLTSTELDGAFVSAAVSLPAAAELIGDIPNIDPLLLHKVRCASFGRPTAAWMMMSGPLQPPCHGDLDCKPANMLGPCHRQYVIRELAARLRPELEAVVKKNDIPPDTAYVPGDFAQACQSVLLLMSMQGCLCACCLS